MRAGLCQLCLEEKRLCSSHILPEFLYRPLYDSRGRAIAFRHTNIKKTWKLQSGLREHLLCRECEQLLCREFEKPFADFWKPGQLLEPLTSRRDVLLTGTPYHAIKLFCLSLLWRADVSSLPQFADVSLSARQRERLRQMILSKDPGRQDEYQIACSAIEHPDGKSLWGDNIIAPPEKVRVEGHHAYLFTFGACSWMFFVTSHAYKVADVVCLKEGGDLPIARLPLQNLRKYAS